MRLKQLESLLEDVEPFREPNNELEQYPTGAHLAACVLAEAHARGDVEGRVVADLGVGGGVLAIASLLAGARRVVGVDVDPGALELCRDNCDAFEPALRPTLRLGSIPEDVARWNADPRAVAAADEADEEDEERDDAGSSSSESEDLAAVEKEGREEEGRDDPSSLPSGRDGGPLRADTVVMNPPFGTRARGVDVRFLRCALGVARTAVYSLHKSSTRAYLERHALHVLRAASATVLAELRYELPRVYAHHRKDSVTIEVDLWRFEPPADGVVGGGGEGAEGAEGAESAEADVDVSVEERQRRARIELRYAGERNRFGDGGIGLDRHPGRGGRPGMGGKGARGAEAAGRGGRGGGGRGGGGRRGRGGGGGAPRVVIR
jgi:predicted RNA methylase